MGYTQQSIIVHGFTSSHNSEQDEIDEKLWEEVVKKIKRIVDNSKYSSINLMVS